MDAETHKAALKAELIATLSADLELLEREQQATREAATHEQAKPENSKDTRALEQSYLARGQAMRVEELREALARVKATAVTPRGADAQAELGALVIAEGEDGERRFLIMPAGGGTRLGGGAVQVVTPQSPMGRALLGKREGDEASLSAGGKAVMLAVVEVR
jgi:transcription elongation GreA/GreB family factor